MVFPIVGGNQSTGDFVTNSLRFDTDDSPSLSLDLSSPNTDKFTISMWVKMIGTRTQLTALGKRLTGEAGDNRSIDIEQNANGRLGISAYNGVADSNVAAYDSNTNAGPLLRDTTAWYHFVYAFDTGQGTAGNRFKWYINGVLQSGYNTTTTPSQNADLFDSSGSMIRIGRALNNESRYGDMYLAQYYYVDGQQYDHTYFGEFNDNGVWVPVENGKGAGGAITFGTNGFYLEFKQTGTSANASGIGADTSGNGKHLTPANLAAIDITTDTPQNNFAIWNSLDFNRGDDLLKGNTHYVSPTSAREQIRSTFGLTSGKWYWETKPTTANGGLSVGVLKENASMTLDDSLGKDAYGWSYDSDGSSRHSNSSTSSGFDTYTSNDIIGVALDLDNHEIFFYKNGTAQNSGNKAFDLDTGETYFAACGSNSSGSTETFQVNFGNAPFAISSGNADANGHGNFEYAPPSGYFALCTKNLAEYG
jgi:hypothetical protein